MLPIEDITIPFVLLRCSEDHDAVGGPQEVAVIDSSAFDPEKRSKARLALYSHAARQAVIPVSAKAAVESPT